MTQLTLDDILPERLKRKNPRLSVKGYAYYDDEYGDLDIYDKPTSLSERYRLGDLAKEKFGLDDRWRNGLAFGKVKVTVEFFPQARIWACPECGHQLSEDDWDICYIHELRGELMSAEKVWRLLKGEDEA